MKLYRILFFAALALAMSCDKEPQNGNGGNGQGTVNPAPAPQALTWSPESPDADSPLTITFTASKTSKLYGYTGDVYAHIGILEYGVWKFVQAEWNENKDKCKFTPAGENKWTITLSPSIREYFGSGEMPVTQIGIVIRSSDGTKKGIEKDSFINVTDNQYQGFVPAEPEQRSLPAGMKYGINVSSDNSSITFVLHDCDTKGSHRGYAYIIGDFNEWTLSNDGVGRMYRDDAHECWWTTISGLDATKEYRYQYHIGDIGGETIRMADAFCEKILDPDNDKYITSIYGGDMTYPEGGAGLVSVVKTGRDSYTWQNSDFKMNSECPLIYELHLRDFSDTKDLDGAMAKLDYLKDLGVDAIELMPIQEFDGNDSWGYNPCFYFALDKAYGSPLKYKQFIDECHKKGMGVIVDVVYNHSTGASPLAKIYWNSSNNRTAANNPYFNVFDKHPFGVFHDFNHENEFVKDLVKRSTVHLIEEYHIDGFRFDLAKGFSQRTCYGTESWAKYDAARIAVLKEYADAIWATDSDSYVILEHFAESSEETELANYGMRLWRNMNGAYCQTAMGYSSDSDFSGMNAGKGWVSYMESHDEERTAYKQTAFGYGILKTDLGERMKQLEMNAVFTLCVPGPKMIWQFGEIGYDHSLEENGRTGSKPLEWGYLEVAQRKHLHDVYVSLAKLRQDNRELFSTGASFTWTPSSWPVRTISASAGSKKLEVRACFGGQTSNAQAVTIPASESTWRDYLTGAEYTGGQTVLLNPLEYLVLVNF